MLRSLHPPSLPSSLHSGFWFPGAVARRCHGRKANAAQKEGERTTNIKKIPRRKGKKMKRKSLTKKKKQRRRKEMKIIKRKRLEE